MASDASRIESPAGQQAGAHTNLTFWITNAQAKARYVEAFQRSDFEAMLNYHKRNDSREPWVEETSAVVKVKSPVLMIHGLKDTALWSPGLNGHWDFVEQDFTLVTIPDVGHFVQQAAPDRVTRSIRSWLAR